MVKTLGIVGGGQLGRMLSESAIDLGWDVWVVDPTPDSPAKQVGAHQIMAGYKDDSAVRELADKCDYLTIEFEHINTAALEEAAKAKPVNPAPATIRLIQDKFAQKEFLKTHGFPTAEFVEITGTQQARKLFKDWGGLMIKSKTEAFDGRGNALIKDISELDEVLDRFKGRGIYGERLVDFQMELAVMAAKSTEGDILTYPVARTVHERNICTQVYAPAQTEPEVARRARKIVVDVVKQLKGAGMYGVELFLDQNGEILINEIAPRVHNSGHYTMDLCDVSQFEQHVRAVTAQKLKEPVLRAEACCMINILGERDGPVELKGVAEAEAIPGVSVYIYGKSPTKIDRKMGHINALGATMEEAKTKAQKARKLISI